MARGEHVTRPTKLLEKRAINGLVIAKTPLKKVSEFR